MAHFALGRRAGIVAAACFLAGCGGGSGNGPGVGSGLTVYVRALNLAPASPSVNVEVGPFGNSIGTVGPLQGTPYATETGGAGQVSFVGQSGPLATFSGNLLYSTYDTVVLYSANGNYGTFALVDNGAPTALTRSQLRVANADSLLSGNVDVYISPGSHSQPVTGSQYLVTPNGLSFGHGTPYDVVQPGPYTVTVVSALDQAELVLNQVVNLGGGEAQTLYVVGGNTSVLSTDDQ